LTAIKKVAGIKLYRSQARCLCHSSHELPAAEPNPIRTYAKFGLRHYGYCGALRSRSAALSARTLLLLWCVTNAPYCFVVCCWLFVVCCLLFVSLFFV